MKRAFLYFFLLLFPHIAHAQAWEWERLISHNYTLASNVIVDKAGNSYFLTNDSSYFVDNQNNTTIKIGDPSLIKISPNGSLIWETPIHSLDPSWLLASFPYYGAINIAPDGNIVACAALPGTLVFGNISLPADTKHPIPNNFQTNLIWTQVFLAECDTSGTWLQASILGATSIADYISGVAIDKNSNVDVAISYRDSLTIGSVSYRAEPYDTNLWYSTFIGSFKMNGRLNWGNNLPGLQIPIYSGLSHLIPDQNNNLYFVLQDTSLSESIYKLRPTGNTAFTKIMPAQIYDFRLDKGDNIYACGSVTDTVDFGNGIVLKGTSSSGNGFMIKYDSTFKAVSGFNLGGSTGNSFLRISLDNSGNLYAMGSFNGQLRLGDSVYTNPNNYYGNYYQSYFIAEYPANGSAAMKAVLPYSNAVVPDLLLDSSGMIIADWFVSENVGYPAFIALGCDTLNGSSSGINVIAKLDPRPPVIQISPFCTGDSLICTSDTSLYKNWIWKFRDGTILSGKKVAYNNPPNGFYYFSLYATNSVGCQVFVKDSFMHPPPPVAEFSIPKDSVACEYTKLVLSDISQTDTIAPGPWPQDTWSFGDGTTSNSTKTTTKIYTDTGTFTIKLVYNNGFCATDTNLNIRVIPAPKPGFSVSGSAGCPPLTVKITPQTLGAITHTYYDFGNGTHDTTSSPSVTYPNSGNYKILQQLTGPTGCVTEDSANIHVRPVFRVTDKTNIGLATVDSPGYADVSWVAWQGTSVYDLYSYTDNDTSTVLVTQTSATSYIDQNVNTAAHYYTYYLLAQDSCGNITGSGRVGRTIRLTGMLDPNLNPKLTWNPYTNWSGGVKTYNIYRKNPDSSFALLSSVKDTSYTDMSFISDAVFSECYKVEATANDTSAISVSNVFCFGNSPQIFIPNVFTPNGDTLNDLFAPVFSGIKSWGMDVYNRWGERVYSSTSPRPSPSGEGESGWDGTFKGQPAPQGIYIYDIKAEDYNGNMITRKGTVILIL